MTAEEYNLFSKFEKVPPEVQVLNVSQSDFRFHLDRKLQSKTAVHLDLDFYDAMLWIYL